MQMQEPNAPNVAAESGCCRTKQQGTGRIAAYLSLRLGNKHWLEKLLAIAFILTVSLVLCFILEEQL